VDTTLTAPGSRSWRRLAAYSAAALAVAAAGTAVGLFVWADSYAPLSLPAGGYGGDVHVITDGSGFGSEGAAVIGSRPATFELDFLDDGRWPVTIDGIGAWPSFPGSPRIVVSHVKVIPQDGHSSPLAPGRPLPARFSRHDGPRLFVSLRADCRHAPPHTFTTVRALAVHYRYLRVFSDTLLVVAPLQLAASCP
jgi:hypothetical protein